MIRKTLTIFSLIGLLLSVGLWVATYFFSIVVATNGSECWELGNGCVGFGRYSYIGGYGIGYGPIGPRSASIYGGGWSYTIPRLWKSRAFDGWETDWVPKLGFNPLSLVLPLWIPLLGFAVLSSYLLRPIYRRRKRKKLGLCLRCGYDLRGSTDRCPECGTGFSDSDTTPTSRATL